MIEIRTAEIRAVLNSAPGTTETIEEKLKLRSLLAHASKGHEEMRCTRLRARISANKTEKLKLNQTLNVLLPKVPGSERRTFVNYALW